MLCFSCVISCHMLLMNNALTFNPDPNHFLCHLLPQNHEMKLKMHRCDTQNVLVVAGNSYPLHRCHIGLGTLFRLK